MENQVGDRLALLQREISFRQNEISKLKQQIGERQSEAAMANISSKVNLDKAAELQQTLLAKDSLIKK